MWNRALPAVNHRAPAPNGALRWQVYSATPGDKTWAFERACPSVASGKKLCATIKAERYCFVYDARGDTMHWRSWQDELDAAVPKVSDGPLVPEVEPDPESGVGLTGEFVVSREAPQEDEDDGEPPDEAVEPDRE